MSNTCHIFVPEWVPLTNKGEEAIIRGMADVIFPEGDVEFHVLDRNARKSYSVDGLHVYPGSWFYAGWRCEPYRVGIKPREVYSFACAVLRRALNKTVPGWIRTPPPRVRKTADTLRRIKSGQLPADGKLTAALKTLLACDYLIAGHDGVFDANDCHVINMMHRLGMSYGILGSDMRTQYLSQAIVSLYHQTLSAAQFIYCRSRKSHDWARSRFEQLDIRLAPDPAFGMVPSPAGRVDEIIRQESLGEMFSRPVVMMTTAEVPPIARHSFRKLAWRRAKRNRHREVLAALVTHIVERCGANVLFLPHAVGPTPNLDDRVVARDVLKKTGLRTERVRILETEYPARDLKALIGRADLLVGERVHSVIGAVGMHTPFMCLGVEQDNRVQSIVGDMCQSRENVHFLNDTDGKRLSAHFDEVWRRRDGCRRQLKSLSAALRGQLEKAGTLIRGIIEESRSGARKAPRCKPPVGRVSTDG